MALRTIPIRRAASRTNLFMGGDRELVMFSILLAAVLIFTSQDWIAAGVGIVIWAGALFLLRKMLNQIRCYAKFICVASNTASRIMRPALRRSAKIQEPKANVMKG